MWILGQATLDQGPELPGQPLGGRPVVGDAVKQRRDRAVAERARAERGERQHCAEAEHVAGGPDLFAQRLFRGHVAGRTNENVGPGQRGGVRGT